MVHKHLSPNPDIEQYRRQAKELRKALAAGDAPSLERLREFHPQGELSRPVKLTDAQLVLAREHGFASWPLFAAQVQASQANGWPESIACDAGSLAIEVGYAIGERGVVLFILAGNVGRQHLGVQQIADRMRRAGYTTVLPDLLTVDEALQDAINEDLRFDVSVLSARAELVLAHISRDPQLSGLPLALLCAGTGGAAGVQLAARCPNAARALISIAGRPDLAGSALARVRSPSLFVVGGEDAVSHGFTRTMLEIFPRDVASRLEVVRGVGSRFEEGPAAARAAELAIGWLHAQAETAEQAA